MNESQRQEQRPVALTINVLKLDTEGIIEDADERNTVLCSVEVLQQFFLLEHYDLCRHIATSVVYLVAGSTDTTPRLVCNFEKKALSP